MAKVTIGVGSLFYGGTPLETSGGTKYAIFTIGYGAGLKIYKNIDSSPSEVASVTPATIFGPGVGQSIDHLAAKIDSNNKIHIACAAHVDDTRDIAYRIFNTATDAWEGAGWEEAAPYTNGAPGGAQGLDLDLDSNGKPHILYVDYVKVKGTPYDQIKYVEKTGASWSAPQLVNVSTTNNFRRPALTLCPGNDIEAVYIGTFDFDNYYRRKNASWGSESSYSEAGDSYYPDVLCTVGDIVYRYFLPAQNIEENDVDIGYNKRCFPGQFAVLVGTDRYIFYIDPSDRDLKVAKNTGAGWSIETLQIGTYSHVCAEWAYNFEYQSGEINYIFDDSTNVYYGALPLGPPAYYHGLKVQGEGELALCDVGNHPLRIRKGGVTYGIDLVAVDDPNASRIRIKTPAGIKAIRKYT